MKVIVKSQQKKVRLYFQEGQVKPVLLAFGEWFAVHGALLQKLKHGSLAPNWIERT